MKPYQVLILTSHPLFVQLLALILRAENDLRVVETCQGIDNALSRITQLNPEVVLLDLDMAGADSFPLIGSLRQASPDVSLVAFTLHEPFYYRKAVLEAGADALISKEALLRELLPAIRRSLHDRAGQGLKTAPFR